MALVKTSKNPAYALTPEKYAAMLKFYLETPSCTITALVTGCNVGRIMAKRAMTLGWPELNLPPIPAAKHQLVDPARVHEEMAALRDARQEIQENLFGPINFENKMVPTSAVQEATARAAEKGMGARVGASVAVKMGRIVETMASKFLDMIENDQVEMPEMVRLEHILALAKASQAVSKAIYDSAQTENLINGEPDDTAGIKITNLLIGASKSELQEVLETGNIPKRLLGLPETVNNNPLIDVEVTDTDAVDSGTEGSEQQETDSDLGEEESGSGSGES